MKRQPVTQRKRHQVCIYGSAGQLELVPDCGSAPQGSFCGTGWGSCSSPGGGQKLPEASEQNSHTHTHTQLMVYSSAPTPLTKTNHMAKPSIHGMGRFCFPIRGGRSEAVEIYPEQILTFHTFCLRSYGFSCVSAQPLVSFCSVQGLSFPTRGQTYAPCNGSVES